MEELSISYFRELLDKNVAELKSYCKEWESLCTDVSIPEEVRDEIRTTIGLTNLLMRQKLKQFGGLIDDSEFERSEKEITCIDLQGFWDMVYSEVAKIQKSFENLEKCQKNNWVFIQEAINKTEPKRKPTLATAKVTVDSKARALAARQRLAEAKLKMKAQLTNECQKTFEVEILSTTNESAQKSVTDKKEVSKVASGKKTICEEHSPPKRTMKNLRNLYISEECEDSPSVKPAKSPKKSPSQEEINKNPKKQRSVSKATRKNGKENLYENKEEGVNSKLQFVTDEKPTADLPKQGKRGSAKNVTPLQCVTRSAKKALLEQQASKK